MEESLQFIAKKIKSGNPHKKGTLEHRVYEIKQEQKRPTVSKPSFSSERYTP